MNDLPNVSPLGGAGASADGMYQSPEQAQQDIKVYQDMLKQLPPEGYAQKRRELEEKIQAAKRVITKSKRVSSQLSACVAALDRAAPKRQKAEEAAKKATEELEAAMLEEDRLTEEKARLEQEIVVTSPQQSCLDLLSSSMRSVLADLQSSTAIDLTKVDQAKAEMETLYKKLNQLAGAAVTSQALSPAQRPRAPKRTSSSPSSPSRSQDNDGDDVMHPTSGRRALIK